MSEHPQQQQPSAIAYQCPRNGRQSSGFGVQFSDMAGNRHTVYHCFLCLTELFTRAGVAPMTPILEIPAQAEDFKPGLDLGEI